MNPSLLLQLPLLIFLPSVFGCYTSIFNFGDSLSDTGNLYYTCSSPHPSQVCFFPYGETFFHRPTGRFSDGRVVLDFFAISLGLPLVHPYRSLGLGAEDFRKGLNFAVGGATALDLSFFQQRGIPNLPSTAVSLRNQLQWFKETYSSICASSPSMCKDVLKSSLFILGEIGGNDYNYFFLDKRNIEELKPLVPLVLKEIASVILELIELGVETLMVPANIPIGCLPVYVQLYKTTDKDQYDPRNGCLKWLNQFCEYHNEQLQEELKRIRAFHPHVHLIYADYFNAAMRIYNAPKEFGLIDPLQVCCVDGNGSYYFPTPCGKPWTSVCDEPSKYVSWDGLHLTEAAYKLMATSLLNGSFTTPQFSISCLQQNSSTKLLHLQ
ncbi:unnamed protein product [Citrullus colocynthis]|uniref:Uncharacterized protein n=1 Tax=Citrullus colocynthis TaxID=252529 RepID=A0ABP0YKQ4_9ROSI